MQHTENIMRDNEFPIQSFSYPFIDYLNALHFPGINKVT
jgi:hypothetical protein